MKQRFECGTLKGIPLLFFVLAASFATAGALTQQSDSDNSDNLDSGPRVGSIGAGGPIAGLTPQQLQFFQNGLSQFVEEEGVTLNGPGNGGLGPTFNTD